jgi:hypothetical protein
MRHAMSIAVLCWFLGLVALLACWCVCIEYHEWRQRREMRALTREYEQWERARQATGGQR